MSAGTASGPLAGLEPSSVWRWFAAVSAIPRESGNEGGIGDFLEDFARQRSLDHLRDEVGNVLIRKGPGGGAEAAREGVVLQAHMDMVAEKTPGSLHDFLADPVALVVQDDGWVTAKDTTLGADNGLGMAAMLALLDSSDLPHPALECLFTVDEERGMVGAKRLDPGWISFGRLVNLDSESDDTFFIGCAGGQDTLLRLDLEREEGAGSRGKDCFELRVSGLSGGHSGVDIGRGGANAIVLLARALDPLVRLGNARIVDLECRGKANVIPRSASAIICSPAMDTRRMATVVEGFPDLFRTGYSSTDENARLSLRPVGTDRGDIPAPLTAESGRRVVGLLLSVPHGVIGMSPVIEGLVETSSNLASVVIESDELLVYTSQRSSSDSGKKAMADRLGELIGRLGGSAEVEMRYPGWSPDPDSLLVGLASSVFEEFFGRSPRLVSVHAGLECGMFAQKLPEVDMISIGPRIEHVHTTEERVSVESVKRFWKLLLGVMEKLS